MYTHVHCMQPFSVIFYMILIHIYIYINMFINDMICIVTLIVIYKLIAAT